MRASKLLIGGLAVEALALAFSAPAENALVEKGKDLFARRCSGCHAPDINKEGPRLRGVYARKAAGLPEFGYSDSLKKLNIRWNEKSLDRWLTNPSAMAPDTDMEFRLSDPEERKALIAYLRDLGSTHEAPVAASNRTTTAAAKRLR
jgi:cytochrome c